MRRVSQHASQTQGCRGMLPLLLLSPLLLLRQHDASAACAPAAEALGSCPSCCLRLPVAVVCLSSPTASRLAARSSTPSSSTLSRTRAGHMGVRDAGLMMSW